MNVSMIVLNPFQNDNRVMKEAKTLVNAGWNVTVNALWADGLPYDETIESIHVRRVRLKLREGIHIPNAVWAELIPKFVLLIQQQKPDVVHAHDLNALLPGYFASKLTRSRLIYDSHELYLEQHPKNRPLTGVKRKIWTATEKRLIRRSDAVITVSNSTAEQLSFRYGVKHPTVIMNCSSLVELPPRGILRAQLGLSPDEFVILFQGALVDGRGLENIIQGLPSVDEAKFVLIGDGPFSETLSNLAQKYKVRDRVYMPGKYHLKDLIHVTRDGDVGVCLTENTCLNHYYTIPNKIFDYMMCAMPVLASNFPELAKIILDCQCGLVTDPHDPAEIARRLRELRDSRMDSAILGANGRSAAETRYNWQVESRRLLEIYANIR